MFITQVTFETDKANDDMLKGIMKKKVLGAKETLGLISAECWTQQSRDAVAYSLVMKWEGKEHFQAWLAQDQAQGGRVGGPGDGPKITKTAYRYEPVDFSEE